MPAQGFNLYLRGGDTPQRRARPRRSRDPFAINAYVGQATDGATAGGAAADAAQQDEGDYEDIRRTPDPDYDEDNGDHRDRLPEDAELSIPHDVVVPDRLKFAKRFALLEERIKADPLTGENRVIKGEWNKVYDGWGLGDKHIQVIERLGIDEALICPKVEEEVVIMDEISPKPTTGTAGAAQPAGPGPSGLNSKIKVIYRKDPNNPKPKAPWYKPWAWEPPAFMQSIGFTSWTSRRGYAIKRKSLAVELGEDNGWLPPRLSFLKTWPSEEDEDAWFSMCYMHLFLRVESFARKYFDLGDMDTDSYHGQYVWLEDLPKEFLWYAKKVARQDNFNGQWDTLLTLSTFRRCLVIGIFAKVLETFIWDELLFGGRKDQFLMLSSQDQSLLGLDGYKRTDLRTRTVRATLRNKALTPYFWASVDDLSVRITAMFMPLVQVLDKHFPESNTTSIRTMHQDIHAIVAEAGYFSIGVTWSHDIFRFSSPFLGQNWDLDQAHYDDGPWNISKSKASNADAQAWRDYEAAVKKAQDLKKQQDDTKERIKQARRARRQSSLAVPENIANLMKATKAAQGEVDRTQAALEAAEDRREEGTRRRRSRVLREGVQPENRRRRSAQAAATDSSSDEDATPAGPHARASRRTSAQALNDAVEEALTARVNAGAAFEIAKTVEERAIKAIRAPEERQLARRKADLRDAEQALENEKRNFARAADGEARTRATRAISRLEGQIKERKQELKRAEKFAAARLVKMADERQRAADDAAAQAAMLAKRPPRRWSWAWLKSIVGAIFKWFFFRWYGRWAFKWWPLRWFFPERDTSMDAIVWPEPPTSTSRLAKVQLVLWPMLQRYSPLGPLDPETKVSREGETIVSLAKSQVIYYAGVSDSTTREHEEAIPTLDTWIKKKRLSRNWAWFKPLLRQVTFFLTLLLVHLAAQRYFPWLDRFLNWLERLFWNLGQGIILCSAALVLNGIAFLLQLIVTIAKMTFWFIYALRNLLARLVGAQLSGPASGLQFSPGGWRLPRFDYYAPRFVYWPEPAATTMSSGGKPWAAAGLQYPELSWESISNLARVIYGEVFFVWKRKALNIEIPYPSIRRAAPVWGFEVPVPA